MIEWKRLHVYAGRDQLGACVATICASGNLWIASGRVLREAGEALPDEFDDRIDSALELLPDPAVPGFEAVREGARCVWDLRNDIVHRGKLPPVKFASSLLPYAEVVGVHLVGRTAALALPSLPTPAIGTALDFGTTFECFLDLVRRDPDELVASLAIVFAAASYERALSRLFERALAIGEIDRTPATFKEMRTVAEERWISRVEWERTTRIRQAFAHENRAAFREDLVHAVTTYRAAALDCDRPFADIEPKLLTAETERLKKEIYAAREDVKDALRPIVGDFSKAEDSVKEAREELGWHLRDQESVRVLNELGYCEALLASRIVKAGEAVPAVEALRSYVTALNHAALNAETQWGRRACVETSVRHLKEALGASRALLSDEEVKERLGALGVSASGLVGGALPIAREAAVADRDIREEDVAVVSKATESTVAEVRMHLERRIAEAASTKPAPVPEPTKVAAAAAAQSQPMPQQENATSSWGVFSVIGVIVCVVFALAFIAVIQDRDLGTDRAGNASESSSAMRQDPREPARASTVTTRPTSPRNVLTFARDLQTARDVSPPVRGRYVQLASAPDSPGALAETAKEVLCEGPKAEGTLILFDEYKESASKPMTVVAVVFASDATAQEYVRTFKRAPPPSWRKRQDLLDQIRAPSADAASRSFDANDL